MGASSCFFTLTAVDASARAGVFTTPHGEIKTPVFMNVATAGAIKGALSSDDLLDVKCQIALTNTYHLHIRPGDTLIHKLGGIGRFMAWDGPILTDSGGFQVFSLAKLRKIKDEGVYFASHIDGRKIFMGPEESMVIQSGLASTIAMAFDECVAYPSEKDYMRMSVDRTTRWLGRCVAKLKELNSREATINNKQILFGINQGGVYKDIRTEHAKIISDYDLPGYSIGGLAVGETCEQMYDILEAVVPRLSRGKPVYLMGVGTPANILEAVERGVDFFDCVLPARNGRHAHVYTNTGKLNLMNKQYEADNTPIGGDCKCPACAKHSKAYIRHLFKAKEMLAMRLCVIHNLFYFNNLMEEIRAAITEGRFAEYKRNRIEGYKTGGI